MGMDFRAAAPKEFHPGKELVDQCLDIASETGAKIMITDDAEKAVDGVDFLYTDVWVSMGEPDSEFERRIKMMMPYQVNKELMGKTNNPKTKFLHCLPSFHNRETIVGEDIYQKFGVEAMEVTDDVFESEASLVFDEAENRLHTIKAVMVATLGS